MNETYWTQRASQWVSASVLLAGIATAFILFALVRIELRVNSFTYSKDYLAGSLSTGIGD
jgi:hypothetical protein